MSDDPLERIVAGPLEHDWGMPDLRVDTDDWRRLVNIYVLKPGTNEAVSQLTFSFDQARELAQWILENTQP